MPEALKTWRVGFTVTSRTLAAVIGGYALAHVLPIFFAVLIPLTKSDAVLLASQASFLIYAAAAIWAFAARTAWYAWVGILVPALVMGLLTWLLL